MMILIFICMMGMGLLALYSLRKFVYYDAQARAMDAKKWSWISMFAQHSEGFLLYLFKRRKYPSFATQEQKCQCQKYKRIFIVAFIAMLMFAIIAVFYLMKH